MDKKINGFGEAFFETGTEGILWAVYNPQKIGYEGLNVLYDGDELTVYQKLPTLFMPRHFPDSFKQLVFESPIVWHGTVDLDYHSRYMPYPLNPDYGQQEIFGYWIHGLQQNLNHEQWAEYFFEEYPMTLKVKSK